MQHIGFIGLGNMGGGMARNLLAAGFPVLAYDRSPAALARAEEAGAAAAAGVAETASACEVIHTCLVGDVLLRIVEREILSHLATGGVLVDHSTIGAPDARRLAGLFKEHGRTYLDAPISGGRGGAEAGTLRIFVGGEEAAYLRVRPHLEAMGDPRKILYGGPSGKGQAMKVMQQLQGRLLNLARLEIIAFGERQGFDHETILRVLDLDRSQTDGFVRVLEGVENGNVDVLSCLFPEWKYYLAEAHAQGIPLPALEGCQAFYSRGERDFEDVVARPSVNLWKELMKDWRPS